MPNKTPATSRVLPGQASTMTPSAPVRMPIRSSNCHVLRASWCSGPSKKVFSLVVMPKSYSSADAETLLPATGLAASHGDREQCRAKPTGVGSWGFAPDLSPEDNDPAQVGWLATSLQPRWHGNLSSRTQRSVLGPPSLSRINKCDN